MDAVNRAECFFFFLGGVRGDLIFNSFVTGGLLCCYTSPL